MRIGKSWFKLLSLIGVIIVIGLTYIPTVVTAQVNSSYSTNSSQEPEETFAPVQTGSDAITSIYRLAPFIVIAAIAATIAVVVFMLWKRSKRI